MCGGKEGGSGSDVTSPGRAEAESQVTCLQLSQIETVRPDGLLIAETRQME